MKKDVTDKITRQSLKKIIKHLDYLSTENFGSLRQAHEHRIEDAGWLYVTAKSLSAEVKRLRVIEEQRRRMGNVLADYCINDVCDEFFEGDYSFYEKLVKAYGWKEGDEE